MTISLASLNSWISPWTMTSCPTFPNVHAWHNHITELERSGQFRQLTSADLEKCVDYYQQLLVFKQFEERTSSRNETSTINGTTLNNPFKPKKTGSKTNYKAYYDPVKLLKYAMQEQRKTGKWPKTAINDAVTFSNMSANEWTLWKDLVLLSKGANSIKAIRFLALINFAGTSGFRYNPLTDRFYKKKSAFKNRTGNSSKKSARTNQSLIQKSSPRKSKSISATSPVPSRQSVTNRSTMNTRQARQSTRKNTLMYDPKSKITRLFL